MKKITDFKRICLVFIAIILTACGTVNDMDTPVSTSQNVEYDWKTKGFVFGDAIDESPLFMVNYEKIDYVYPLDALTSEHFQTVYDNDYYILDCYYTSHDTINIFQRISDETDTLEPITLTAEQWGISDGHILGMDVIKPSQCAFWVSSDYFEMDGKQMAAQHYYVVYTDVQGNQLQSVDIIDTLREHEIWKSQPITYVGTAIHCDSQGNLYLHDQNNHTIYLLNQDGELIISYSYQPSENHIFECIRVSDGELIFVCGSREAPTFVWLDPNTGTSKQLAAAVTGLDQIWKWYGLYGDTLYCATRKQLIGWNISTGDMKILLKLDENAVEDVYNTSLLKTGDNFRLLVTEKSKRYVLTLSTEEPAISGKITFVNICSENSYLAGRVVNFSRENPKYGISYEVAESKDRVLMEMATGEGPDILYVSREDMDHLQTNGVLGNLKLLLSQETLDALLPGAVEMGTYDRELLGLPIAVNVRSLVTSQKYWQGSSWTLEDVLAILKEHKELTGLFTDFFGQDNYFYNMYFLLGMDLEHSSFLVNGEGRFDSPEFKEILSWVKKKTNNKDGFSYNGPVGEAIAKSLQEGEYLGIEFTVSGMADFGSYYARMGESFQPTGYPTETGRGHYMQPVDGGVIVVNQNSMEKDGMKELLEYLFCLESQQRIGYRNISVRMDIPESQLIYMEDKGQYFWVDPGRQMTLLPEKYDGTSYLDEYVEFLRNAVPYPTYSDKLFNIIIEEADSYFYSNKDLDETARVIQQKVQLYLDEQK